jgi:hypothetical protein
MATDPPTPPPPFHDDGSKAVEIATDRVAKDYDRALDHSQHVSQRAATLVGFAGVTLALTATQARALVTGSATDSGKTPSPDLGKVGQPLSMLLLAIASALFGLGIALLIRALVPRKKRTGIRDLFRMDLNDLRYVREASGSEPADEVRRFLMGADLANLTEQYDVNDSKFKDLVLGSWLVLAGIVALAIEVFIPLVASLD